MLEPRPDLLDGVLPGATERLAPAGTTDFVLFTGRKSERNLRTYQRAGYSLDGSGQLAGLGPDDLAVYLTKPASSRAGG